MLDKLEQKRVECVMALKLATKVLEHTSITYEHANLALEDAQRQVNHWQMMLDDTDNDIRRAMEIERNERGEQS